MFDQPKPQLPAVSAAPPPPPLFGSDPAQKKKQPKSMQPTFLGNGMSPGPAQLGTKTLLGQ